MKLRNTASLSRIQPITRAYLYARIASLRVWVLDEDLKRIFLDQESEIAL